MQASILVRQAFRSKCLPPFCGLPVLLLLTAGDALRPGDLLMQEELHHHAWPARPGSHPGSLDEAPACSHTSHSQPGLDICSAGHRPASSQSRATQRATCVSSIRKALPLIWCIYASSIWRGRCTCCIGKTLSTTLESLLAFLSACEKDSRQIQR